MEERKPEPLKVARKPESVIVTPKEDTPQKGRDLCIDFCTVPYILFTVMS